MAGRATGFVLAAATLCCACAAPPAAQTKGPPRSAQSRPPAEPAGTLAVPTTPGAPALAPLSPPAAPEAPGTVRDFKPLSDALVFHTLGSWPGPAWTVGADGKVFFMALRGAPADRHAALLPYPPAGREAAMAGRSVTVAEIWSVRPGAFVRVHVHPIGLRSMVCEEDEDCEFVASTTNVNAAGAFEVGSGSCEKSLASLSTRSRDTGTYDVYDRAVIPAICRATGTFAWNGAAFARASTPSGSSAAARIATEASDVMETIVSGMLPGSIASSVERNTPLRSGDGRLVVLRATYPAPAHAFFAHTAAARIWESGRTIEVAEIWLARDQSFRRVMQVPVGLGSLAEPDRVLSLEVELSDDELVVGGDDAACGGGGARRDEPERSPEEAALRERDRDATTRICSGRGAYRFDGGSFTRRRPSGPSSF